jgi:hypothetical protein
MTTRSALASPWILVAALACGPGAPAGETGATDPGSTGSTSGSTSGTTGPDPTSSSTAAPTSSGGTSSSGESGESSSTGGPVGCFHVRELGADPGCDVGAQEGCCEGEKCVAFGEGLFETTCVALARDPAQPGEPCAVQGGPPGGQDDCDKGSVCWDLNAEGEGTCVPVCGEGCARGTMCAQFGELPICLTTCDPLAGDCAQADDVCAPEPAGDGFVCLPDVSGPGGARYEPCDGPAGCDDGLLCSPSALSEGCTEGPLCCLALCDAATDPNPACEPGNGEVCVPLFDEGAEPAGLEDLGVCAIP